MGVHQKSGRVAEEVDDVSVVAGPEKITAKGFDVFFKDYIIVWNKWLQTD